MGDEAIKRRGRRAKVVAMGIYEKMGYDIIPSNNSPVCFIASSEKKGTIMVHVVLDEITDNMIEQIRQIKCAKTTSKDLICFRKGEKNFDIKEIG